MKRIVTAAAFLAALGLAAPGRAAPRDANKPLSLPEMEAQVESLHQEDVAWRKIAWRTCLLDGLRESHQANKPLMLWIFIDRPINDERC